MERKYPESQLSPLVTEWLRSLGCSVYSEITVMYSRPVDHVGIRWSDETIVAVEMKTTLSWKAILQARQCQNFTEDVYIAVSCMPRKSSIERCQKYGFGLWNPSGVILAPVKRVDVIEKYRNMALERCRNRPEGGTGGLPTIKGDGPRIRCIESIRQYLLKNPSASWREIFAAVPNHYAHHRSLQGAMPPREYFLTNKERT